MYGGYYGYGYYWDPTYFLVLVGLVLCLGASALVNSTMRKYSKVRNCLLYTSPSPRDRTRSRMPSSA